MLSSSSQFLRTVALPALALLAACSSGSKDAPTPATPVGLRWTADGMAQSSSTFQSQKSTTTLLVSGTIPSSRYLLLEFPNAVGTYPFGATAAASGTYTTIMGSASTSYYAGASGSGTLTGAGTVVVTALTATNVTGTFTFTGISTTTGASKSVTNGTFNVGL